MRRVMVNVAAGLMLLLSLACLAMWHRSRTVDDAWVFQPRAVPGPPVLPPAPGLGFRTVTPSVWELNRVLASTRGRIVWIEYEQPFYGVPVPGPTGWVDPVPQQLLDTPDPSAPRVRGAVQSSFFGVEWGALPVRYKGPTSHRIPGGNPLHIVHVSVPLYVGPRRYIAVSWLVPAAISLPVLPLVIGWRRAMRRRPARRLNLCVACGYDLTGNTSGVCPECGTRR